MKKEPKVIGWREWVKLPDLGISFIKAKVDTGAKTSSLHAFDMEVFRRRGVEYVQFTIHPEQRNNKYAFIIKTKVLEYRNVKSSTGHETKRPVILTDIELLGERWPIELTLADRDEMGFRMLLGRDGFRGKALVDASKSFCSEKPKRKPKNKS